MLVAAILVVFPFCMVYAAISDLLSMTIANRVSIILIASFMALAPLSGMDWMVYALHILAAVLMLLATFGLFALGGMGGGDAKLMTATALWVGLDINLVKYLVISAFVGGLLTLAILFYRRSAIAIFAGRIVFLRRIGDHHAGIPYGIALGTGGLAVFTDTPLMVWALGQIASP